jgi:hypothetical protein
MWTQLMKASLCWDTELQVGAAAAGELCDHSRLHQSGSGSRQEMLELDQENGRGPSYTPLKLAQ